MYQQRNLFILTFEFGSSQIMLPIPDIEIYHREHSEYSFVFRRRLAVRNFIYINTSTFISNGSFPRLQVRTLFVSGLPMDAKPRELYLLFRAYEVSFIYDFVCLCGAVVALSILRPHFCSHERAER